MVNLNLRIFVYYRMSDTESSVSSHGSHRSRSRSSSTSSTSSSSSSSSTSSSSSRSRSRSGSRSDKARDKDEQDSEEYDSEEENDRPRKKRKTKRCGGFIVDEAEEGDDEEEEDEWEDGAYELGIVDGIDESGPTARNIERSRRGTPSCDSTRTEEFEEYLKAKYVDQNIKARHFGDGGDCMSDEITQQTLLPDIKDPNLWMVKCRIGEEKATALLLMRKFLAYQNTSQPLQIKSVVAPSAVKGCIYVEAFKQAHVEAAIKDVGSLRIGYYKQQMVPIKEMPDVLRVVKGATLKCKQWVRLKNGLYKGDIAQIDYIDQTLNKIQLKLLPRIDYTRRRGVLKTAQSVIIFKFFVISFLCYVTVIHFF